MVTAIIDSSGRVANSTTQWPPTGTMVADRDYFQYFKNKNDTGIYISSLLRNRVSGVRTIFFTRRINGKNDEFLGIALIGLRLSYFEGVYKSVNALRDQSFVLLHPDGTVLLRYPDAQDRSDEKIPAGSPWYELAASGGGSYRSPRLFRSGTRVMFSVRPLHDYPLIINVAVTESAALASWYRRAMLIGIGTLLGVICSIFLLRSLGKQFRRLFESEGRLAQREASLAERTDQLRLAHFRSETALNNMSQGLLMFDAQARLILVNRRYIEMYGLSAEIVKPGCAFRDLVAHRQELGVFSIDIDTYCNNVLADVAARKTASRIIELKDGRTIHAVNHPVTAGGWVGTHEDITERKQAQARLAQETSENRRLFETSLDLILVTDRAGNFLRVSPISSSILGYAPEEMIGRNGVDFVYPPDLENAREEMRLARSGHNMRNFETRYVHKRGHAVTLAWSGVWSEPEQKHFFTGRDVPESKIVEEKLRYLAHYDQLTGLANRVSLQNDLTEGPHGGRRLCRRRHGHRHFRSRRFQGHQRYARPFDRRPVAGEGGRALDLLRAGGGRFYRIGGDEFVLVVPGCGDPRDIAHMVGIIIGRLAEKFDVNGHQLFIGASAGIAIAPADGGSVEELISSADLALYDAKAAGGSAYRLFMPVLLATAHARRKLDDELRRAWVNREFRLYFQPQVRAHDGAVVGAEALIRWQHPQLGILAPGAFIDALGESPGRSGSGALDPAVGLRIRGRLA